MRNTFSRIILSVTLLIVAGCPLLGEQRSADTLSQRLQAAQEDTASTLGVPVRHTNSLGMELVLIPPGEFVMGSPANAKHADINELPQHRVRITRAFHMGVCEAAAFCRKLSEQEGRTYRAGAHCLATSDCQRQTKTVPPAPGAIPRASA